MMEDKNMKSKKCSKCKELKSINEFHKNRTRKDGYEYLCKDCKSKRAKKYYLANSKKILESTKKYQIFNKEKIKERSKKYYINNRDRINKRIEKYRESNLEKFKEQQRNYCIVNSEKIKERQRNYRITNPEKVKESAKRYKARKRKEPSYRLSNSISCLIRRSLKENKNGWHWEKIVGYTLGDLMAHLEKQFKFGMSWDNYGYYGWHIDHRKPISSFNFKSYEDKEFKQCWNLNNLQPLWGKENISKKDKFEIIREAGIMTRELREIGVIKDE